MLRCGQLIGMAAGVALGGVSAWVTAAGPPATTPRPPATTQGAQTIPARDVQRKNPIPADAGSRATGKQVYGSNCAPCHGASGKGDGPIANLQTQPPANLTDAKFANDTDGALFWKLGNGHPPMPKFDNLLPDESRWNVVNHLRTLIVVPGTSPATVPSTQSK